MSHRDFILTEELEYSRSLERLFTCHCKYNKVKLQQNNAYILYENEQESINRTNKRTNTNAQLLVLLLF